MGKTDIDERPERTIFRKQPKGKLMIIGGGERKDEDQVALKAIAAEVRKKRRPLLIVTAASYANGGADDYIKIFHELEVKEVDVLEIPSRDAAYEEANAEKVRRACGLFFTGGDQLRITSQIGDSLVYRSLMESYVDGCLIAGTSAGAAAMPTTMIIGGPGDESNRISTLSMAPGLGLLDGVVIDSHFAERGRMGRLLGAVAQNPRNLGIGIDEATAIVVEHGNQFTVMGPGAVYVVDGSGISYSSLSEDNAEGVISIYGVQVHVLSDGDCYDLVKREPVARPAESEPSEA